MVVFELLSELKRCDSISTVLPKWIFLKLSSTKIPTPLNGFQHLGSVSVYFLYFPLPHGVQNLPWVSWLEFSFIAMPFCTVSFYFFFLFKGLLGKALSFPKPSFAQARRTVLPSTVLFVELSSFFPRRRVALEGRVCVLLSFAVVSVCFLFFWDRVLLGPSDCHGTHYVDKLVLNLQRYT